jgi:hypothetical protein
MVLVGAGFLCACAGDAVVGAETESESESESESEFESEFETEFETEFEAEFETPVPSGPDDVHDGLSDTAESARMPIANPDGADGIHLVLLLDEELDSTFDCYDGDDDLTELEIFEFFELFIHGSGHMLGLLHGGHANANFKLNYPSVMNYRYAHRNFYGSPNTLAGTKLDYSRGLMPAVDQCEGKTLDERAFVDHPTLTFADLAFINHGRDPDGAPGTKIRVFQDRGVDFDRDGDADDSAVNARGIVDGDACRIEDSDDFARIAARMRCGLPGNPTPCD